MKMDRRTFLGGCTLAAVQAALALPETSMGKPIYHAFSRVFQFLKDPYKTAEFLRSCGYDGVEWTVRPGGFCEPLDAPRRMKELKDAANKAGILADNIVVSFCRGDEDGAEAIAAAARDAGFLSFRAGYSYYDRTKTHQWNMDEFQRVFDSLEVLARKTGLKACYQNHSTFNKSAPLLGSLVWDLASVVKNYDPKYLGVQYDPMHARAEGGPSWDHTLGAIAPWIDIVCLKDFHYVLDPENPKDWKRKLVPAGEGIVDFAEVKRMMGMEGVKPRFTVHYDYAFPSDEDGARKCATADLRHYRSYFG